MCNMQSNHPLLFKTWLLQLNVLMIWKQAMYVHASSIFTQAFLPAPSSKGPDIKPQQQHLQTENKESGVPRHVWKWKFVLLDQLLQNYNPSGGIVYEWPPFTLCSQPQLLPLQLSQHRLSAPTTQTSPALDHHGVGRQETPEARSPPLHKTLELRKYLCCYMYYR